MQNRYLNTTSIITWVRWPENINGDIWNILSLKQHPATLKHCQLTTQQQPLPITCQLVLLVDSPLDQSPFPPDTQSDHQVSVNKTTPLTDIICDCGQSLNVQLVTVLQNIKLFNDWLRFLHLIQDVLTGWVKINNRIYAFK